MKQTPKFIAVLSLILIFLLGAEEARPEGVDFRQLEGEVFSELNLARSAPQTYASHLREMRKYFHGKEWRRPGELPILTQEGVPALTEAIRFMEKATPVSTLRLSEGMSRGARELVEEQRRTGEIGHGLVEGSRAHERIARYGTWERMVGENIVYGYGRARNAVSSLLIDDGVPNRGHRQNIMNPTFRVVGIACGPHPVYQTMCVVIFAGGFHEKKE